MLDYGLTGTTGCSGSTTTDDTSLPAPTRRGNHRRIFAHHRAPRRRRLLLVCDDLYGGVGILVRGHASGDCLESTSAWWSPLKSAMTSDRKSWSLEFRTCHPLLPPQDTSQRPLALRAMSVKPSPSKSAKVSCDSGTEEKAR